MSIQYEESVLLHEVIERIKNLKDNMPNFIISNSENCIVESCNNVNTALDEISSDLTFIYNYHKL